MSAQAVKHMTNNQMPRTNLLAFFQSDAASPCSRTSPRGPVMVP